jgi:hypothetical protein
MNITETMNNGHKFKFEYELPQDDEICDTSKIRFITYGNTAKEAVENHGKFMCAWENFLEKQAKKSLLKDNDKLK